MSHKIRISENASKQLDTLSSRLDLRKNIVCRIAVGRSLADPTSVSDYKPKDSAGIEFNRSTLTGDHDDIYRAFITQHQKENLTDQQYFSKYLRNHIERGLKIIFIEYQQINSPIDYLIKLTDLNKGHPNLQLEK